MWFELTENRIPTVNPSTSVSVGSSPTAPKKLPRNFWGAEQAMFRLRLIEIKQLEANYEDEDPRLLITDHIFLRKSASSLFHIAHMH